MPSSLRYSEVVRCGRLRSSRLRLSPVLSAPPHPRDRAPTLRPATRRAFTETFAKLCREAAPNVKLTIVGPLSLQADTAQGEVSVHLDTVYSACQRDPAGCGPFLNSDGRADGQRLRLGAAYGDAVASARHGSPVELPRRSGGGRRKIGRDRRTVGRRFVGVRRPRRGDVDRDARQSRSRRAQARRGGSDGGGKTQYRGDARGEISGRARRRSSPAKASPACAATTMSPACWPCPTCGRRSPSASTANFMSPRRPPITSSSPTRGRRGTPPKWRASPREIAHAAKRPLSTDVFEWTPTGWEVVDLAKAK